MRIKQARHISKCERSRKTLGQYQILLERKLSRGNEVIGESIMEKWRREVDVEGSGQNRSERCKQGMYC